MRTALYRHYDADAQLLYVGVSLSAVSRLRQHRAAACWFEDIDHITIEWFDTREAAIEAEKAAIKQELPVNNKLGRKPTEIEIELKTKLETVRHELEETKTILGRHRAYTLWVHELLMKADDAYRCCHGHGLLEQLEGQFAAFYNGEEAA